MPDRAKDPVSKVDRLLDMWGPIASPLRKNFVLGLAILAGAVVAVAVPKIFVDKAGTPETWTTPVTITFGIVAAIAVLLDRIADSYDKRDRNRELSGSESTAEASVSELNSFLREAVEVTFLEGDARAAAMSGLKRNLVRFAANSIGPGSRATYYTLLDATPGARCLGDPQHATTVGRTDMPSRNWFETKNPTHEMWRILDAADSHPKIRNVPEAIGDTVWGEVPYDTFLTVPVKAHERVFGVVSVNNATAGAIGDAQRAVILAMARVMALTLAFDAGVTTMTSGSRDNITSAGTVTVRPDEENRSEAQHD
ncbi:hypothetical protein [Curtobacterium flaccumfaciens]|uniref:hypothetical protein n=1 Tax=Curtobacterium flaccumfaciens TaxID=2035 RepID=UPI0038790C40